MCSMSVLCPLCAVPSFDSLEQLQQRLIKAANGPLACPFEQCKEQFLGLDKLTIHLFTHTSLMASDGISTRTTALMNSTDSAATSQLKIQKQKTRTETMRRKVKKRQNESTTELSQKSNDAVTTLIPSTTVMDSATCDICEFSFRNTELRDMHFRLVHENLGTAGKGPITSVPTSDADNEPLKCHLCAKKFKLKGSLRLHLKVVHMQMFTPNFNICDRIRHKEARTATQSNSPEQPQIDVVESYTLSPTVTVLSSLTPSDVTAHSSPIVLSDMDHNSRNNSNSNVLLVFNTANLTTINPLAETDFRDSKACVIADTNPKIWECDVCAKSFTTKYFLKKHKRLHTGEMPYTCEICARTFTFQQSYHKHLLYHSEIKPHVCTICGRAFKELSTLHNHERIHSGEKPFKCEVCGKCFRQRVSFLVHTRIHTGVMPYKCNTCQKSFRYKVSQRTHKCVDTPLESALVSSVTSVQNVCTDQLAEINNKGFIENNIASTYTSLLPIVKSQNSPPNCEVAAITEVTKCSLDAKTTSEEEEMLTKTIDDIVIESCQKLGIGYGNEVATTSIPTRDATNSPLEKLQNLRLYSPDHAASVMFDNFLLDESGNSLLQ